MLSRLAANGLKKQVGSISHYESIGRLYNSLHEWLIFMENVGKDTMTMDPIWHMK